MLISAVSMLGAVSGASHRAEVPNQQTLNPERLGFLGEMSPRARPALLTLVFLSISPPLAGFCPRRNEVAEAGAPLCSWLSPVLGQRAPFSSERQPLSRRFQPPGADLCRGQRSSSF